MVRNTEMRMMVNITFFVIIVLKFYILLCLYPFPLTAFHFDNCDGKSILGGGGVKNNRLSENIRDKLCKISRNIIIITTAGIIICVKKQLSIREYSGKISRIIITSLIIFGVKIFGTNRAKFHEPQSPS